MPIVRYHSGQKSGHHHIHEAARRRRKCRVMVTPGGVRYYASFNNLADAIKYRDQLIGWIVNDCFGECPSPHDIGNCNAE